MTVVLMYHGLYRGSDTSAIDEEDLPYAISERAFVEQLDCLEGLRIGLLDSVSCKFVAESAAISHAPTLPDVMISFDDGHASNHSIALPHLVERGWPACFFVTSEYIDRRRGFCTGSQLREMVLSGMQVGAHGATHAFLDNLSPGQGERELVWARADLEKHTGRPVTSLSFPGGRWSRASASLARGAGYVQLYGSEFGTVESPENWHRQVLGRVAVRRDTSLAEFRRMIEHDPAYYRSQQIRQAAKHAVRSLVGNRAYHGLYQFIASR